MSSKGFVADNPNKQNQDSYFGFYDANTNTTVIGVLDGHGEHGTLAANFVAQTLPNELSANYHFTTDLHLALHESICNTENHLLRIYHHFCAFSGSTLCVAAVRGDRLFIANVGDSRAVMGNASETRQLSRDHKANLPDEVARIEKFGGRVVTKTYADGYVGPPRVYLGDRDLPGLAMSRSIGDVVVRRVGVISDPEIFEFHKSEFSGQTLILATDGLWDFLKNEDAMEMASSRPSAQDAVETLITSCRSAWKAKSPDVIDDITAAAIIFSSE